MEKSIKENREYVYKELLPRLTENFATFQSYEVAVQNWKPVVDDLKELQRITKIIGDYDEQLAQEIVNTWNSRAEIVKSGDFGTREETYTRLVPDWSGDIEAVEEGSGVAGQTAGIRELPITAAGKWCDGVVSSRHG